MSLRRLWKATRLTLAIVGLSVVHSFSIGEMTVAEGVLEGNNRTWLSNNQSAGELSKPETGKISQLVPTMTATAQ